MCLYCSFLRYEGCLVSFFFYIYRTDCFKQLLVSGNIMFQKEYTQRKLRKLNIFKLGYEAPIRLVPGHVCTTHN